MSGAEAARRPVVQRRIGGAEVAFSHKNEGENMKKDLIFHSGLKREREGGLQLCPLKADRRKPLDQQANNKNSILAGGKGK